MHRIEKVWHQVLVNAMGDKRLMRSIQKIHDRHLMAIANIISGIEKVQEEAFSYQ